MTSIYGLLDMDTPMLRNQQKLEIHTVLSR